MKGVFHVKNKRKNIVQHMVTFIITCIMAMGIGLTASADTVSQSVLEAAASSTGVTYYAGEAEKAAEKVATTVQTVANSIAVIGVVALAIVLLTGGSQALQKSKGMAIGILLGVIVLSSGVSLFQSLIS